MVFQRLRFKLKRETLHKKVRDMSKRRKIERVIEGESENL